MKKNKYLIGVLFFAYLHCDLYAIEDPFNAYILTIEDNSDGESTNIVIKDNIDLEGFPTTAGSLAIADNIAEKDAFIVKKLKQKGFHISGKTNLSEWANFRSEKSISGWSSYGGQTLNPYGDNLNPCGSSSGSAVAVASGSVDLAIGTETNGSISCPASVNGIVGFKPTVGLVSRQGIIPISSTQDTAGPMGKSVKLVAEVLETIAGSDIDDTATLLIPKDFNYDFTSELNKNSIVGKRLGLLRSGENYEAANQLLEKITNLVTSLGGTIVEIDDSRVYPSEDSYFLLLYEFKIGVENYLSKSSSSIKTVQSLIEFNNKNAATMMPYFEQEIFQKSIETVGKIDKYKQALQMVISVREDLDKLLEDNNLDGFIGLTRNPAWKIDNEGGDRSAMSNQMSFGNGAFAAIAGYPHLTIPMAKIDGLPVGISIIGTAWSDAELLKIGFSLESNSDLF